MVPKTIGAIMFKMKKKTHYYKIKLNILEI